MTLPEQFVYNNVTQWYICFCGYVVNHILDSLLQQQPKTLMEFQKHLLSEVHHMLHAGGLTVAVWNTIFKNSYLFQLFLLLFT